MTNKWLLTALVWNLLLGSCAANAQTNKTPELIIAAHSGRFESAAEEYRDIWRNEGDRIVAAMEKITGLKFSDLLIQVEVYEGPSFSGYGNSPMRLRASYRQQEKRATLVHELGHRLIARIARGNDSHPVLNLFLYDVWVELWGKDFADEQVKVESSRRGLYDYEKAWSAVLSASAERRRELFNYIRDSHAQPQRRRF